jgi:hypothetical protein
MAPLSVSVEGLDEAAALSLGEAGECRASVSVLYCP